MSREPRLNLKDILERIERIERYTSQGRELFLQFAIDDLPALKAAVMAMLKGLNDSESGA